MITNCIDLDLSQTIVGPRYGLVAIALACFTRLDLRLHQPQEAHSGLLSNAVHVVDAAAGAHDQFDRG